MGMKTSWVLTEEDKTKLAMRREASPIAGINVGDGGLAPIHIKKVKKSEFLTNNPPPLTPTHVCVQINENLP